MRLHIDNQKGFTLLEMLIAVVILAVGLLGLAQLQVTAIHANSQSNTAVVAAALGQSILEDINRMEGDDPKFKTTTAGYVDWPASPTISVVGGGTYSVQYKTTANYQGVSNISRVEIKVESVNAVQKVSGLKKQKAELSTLKRFF